MVKKDSTEQNQKFRDFIESEVLNKYPRKELLYRLDITESTLGYWRTGKINAINMPLSSWLRLSSVSGFSLDELFKKMDIYPSDEEYKNLRASYSELQFKQLIKDLLSGRKQTELAKILDVNTATVSKWVSEGSFKPENLSALTFAKIAAIKGWEIEDLMVLLGIKIEKVPSASLSEVQERILSLSKDDREDLLSWLVKIIYSGLPGQG